MQGYTVETMSPGFADPVEDNQRTFRAVLQTMSRPGTVAVLGNRPQPPAPLHPAAASVCLALVDVDTPLWLPPNTPAEVATYLRFHCGCPLTEEQGKASFAVVLDGTDLPDLSAFHPGNLEYPDRSATLIIQVSSIEVGVGARLSGPGIEQAVQVSAGGLSTWFWQALQQNNLRFPLGYDVILASKTEIVSLPRTLSVEV